MNIMFCHFKDFSFHIASSINVTKKYVHLKAISYVEPKDKHKLFVMGLAQFRIKIA